MPSCFASATSSARRAHLSRRSPPSARPTSRSRRRTPGREAMRTALLLAAGEGCPWGRRRGGRGRPARGPHGGRSPPGAAWQRRPSRPERTTSMSRRPPLNLPLGHVPDALPIDRGGAGDGGPRKSSTPPRVMIEAAHHPTGARTGCQTCRAVRSREGCSLAHLWYSEADAVEDQVMSHATWRLSADDGGCRRGGGTPRRGPRREASTQR